MNAKKLIWISTSCDGCGTGGLRVLVPENTDGSVGGREFPSLCRVCHETPAVHEKVVRKFLADEGVELATVTDPHSGTLTELRRA